MQKIEFTIKIDIFEKILNVVEDLSKVGDKVRLTIVDDALSIYSLIKQDNSLKILKFYFYKNTKAFNAYNGLDIIVANIKKFHTKNKLLLKDNINAEDIKVVLYIEKETYPDTNIGDKLIENFQIATETLKLNFTRGDFDSKELIDFKLFENKVDDRNALCNFEIDFNTFSIIKKLSAAYDDEDIYIQIKDNKLYFKEAKWDKFICDIDYEDMELSFKKVYFKYIHQKKKINFYIFPTFICVKDAYSYTLFSRLLE